MTSWADLSPDEQNRITLYRERVEDLLKSGLVAKGVGEVTVDFNASAQQKLRGVDEDYLRAFLLPLRQFMMEGEPVFFFAMCNLVHQKCDRPELQAWVAVVRRDWKHALESSPLGLKIRGEKLVLDDILDLLCYGGLFHSDRDKAERLRNMSDIEKAMLNFLLLGSIKALSRPVMMLRTLMRLWLDAPHEPVPSLPSSLP